MSLYTDNYIKAEENENPAETITGQGHPFYFDVKNRLGKALWQAFQVEHSTSGKHTTRSQVTPLVGTFASTGNIQTVTLADTGAAIRVLLLWSAAKQYIYLATDTMASGYCKVSRITYQDTAFNTNRSFAYSIIRDIATVGEFEVLVDAGTWYYWALTTSTAWTDIGTNTDPPNWVTHAESCLGGTAEMANRVEKKIYDNLFTVGHNDSGSHKAGAFAGVAKIETGLLTPNGAADQNYVLDDTALDIKALILIEDNRTPIFMQTEGMTTLRGLDNLVLPDTGYVTLGTGEFDIDGTVMDAEKTVLTLTEGVDGTQVFTDESDYETVLGTEQGDTGPIYVSLPYWSSTQAHGGSTSIRFAINGSTTTQFLGTSNPIKYHQPHLGMYADFEIDFWIYLASTVTSEGLFFRCSGVYTYDNIGLTLFIYDDGVNHVVQLKINQNSTYIHTITSTTPINDDSWHRITITRTSGVLSLEIDAGSEGTPVVFATPIGGDVTMFWGSNIVEAGAYFYIDDISVKRTNPIFRDQQSMHFIAIGE